MALLPMPLEIDPDEDARLVRFARFSFTVTAILALLAFAGVAHVGLGLFDERALWRDGVPGQLIEYDVEEETETLRGLTFYRDYEVSVRYIDVDGGEHRGLASFGYSLGTIDPEQTPILKHHPAAPDRFVLSYQGEGGLPRWLGLIVSFAFVLLLAWMAYLVLALDAKRRRQERLLATDGEQIVATMTNLNKVRRQYIFQYRLPGEAQDRVGTLPVYPFTVGAKRDHCLVLRSKSDPSIHRVLRYDLFPYAFSSEEVDEINARVAAGEM